jgi:hypothetical protein
MDGTTPSAPCANSLNPPQFGPGSAALHVDDLPPPKPLPVPTEDSPGSVIHRIIQDQEHPSSPSSPVDFPFSLRSNAIKQSFLAELPAPPLVSDSIVRVVGCPHILGLQQNSQSSVKIRPSNTPSLLIDGGTNICVTGNLSILVGVVDIPPLPITVAIKDSKISIDNC